MTQVSIRMLSIGGNSTILCSSSNRLQSILFSIFINLNYTELLGILQESIMMSNIEYNVDTCELMYVTAAVANTATS